jgi:superfamily II DNA/RNA helicase
MLADDLPSPAPAEGTTPTSFPLVNDRLTRILANQMGIRELFPIQQRVIPVLLGKSDPADQLSSSSLPGAAPLLGDVCVCAPTGSGKTLCYAIPIVQVCFLSFSFFLFLSFFFIWID